jgi:CubicO group peptidase (beta-lactamase class C family)
MSSVDPAPTAHELGLMHGTPPVGDALVTLANWQDPPFNRWAFQHVRELVPNARIARSATVREFPRDQQELGGIEFTLAGERHTVEEMLDATYTDGFLVLHRGRIVTERYFNGLSPDRTHLVMSVTKSVVATVVGILAGRGELDPEGLITSVIPELEGTSWEGATVRHLLDMRAGTKFSEDYTDLDAEVRVFEQVYLWRPRTDDSLPEDACTYMAGLENDRPHGGPFDYRSILTSMLGWVAERAGGARLADLIAREVWQPIGAEFDAEITVDAHGTAMADGGMCATLRDLARFGALWLGQGKLDGRRIIPEEWVADTLAGGAAKRVLPQQVVDARFRTAAVFGPGDQRSEDLDRPANRDCGGQAVDVSDRAQRPVRWAHVRRRLGDRAHAQWLVCGHDCCLGSHRVGLVERWPFHALR